MKTYYVRTLGAIMRPVKIEATKLRHDVDGCTQFMDENNFVVAIIVHVPGLVISDSDEGEPQATQTVIVDNVSPTFRTF
jgi:hypothetical protein